ncbi:MAG: hypothetical protein OK452_01930 [Thaumarchaeota archaeon]|nr:hypothetical protein [Nitrososphaerota archaeon]
MPTNRDVLSIIGRNRINFRSSRKAFQTMFRSNPRCSRMYFEGSIGRFTNFFDRVFHCPKCGLTIDGTFTGASARCGR